MKREAQPGDTLDLELEGKISLVTSDKDGKEVGREDLDGELVLKTILVVIEHGLNELTEYSTILDSSPGEAPSDETREAALSDATPE